VAPVITLALVGTLSHAAVAATVEARPRALPIAGYVSAIDGRSSECLIARGRKQAPARFWQDLLVGDQVIANGDCRIEIMPRDGPRRWTVMRSNSPTELTVRATRTVPLPKELEPVGLALSQWNDDLQPPLPPPPPKVPPPRKGKARPVVVTAPVVTRPAGPPPLAMPLLAGPATQRLVAEPRRLNLDWIGGKSPFTVTLASATNPASAWIFQIGDERVVSSVVNPDAGQYDISIHDAAGASVAARIEFVPQAPALDTRDLDNLPPGIAHVLSAVRLANVEGGAWRLEAESRLVEEARDNYAAELMARRLLAGKPLPNGDVAAAGGPPIAASPVTGAAAR
jgi:hypothetical protein